MSEYGKPTDFNFGHNIHDFDPDVERKSGKQTEVLQDPPWYERSPDGKPNLYALVSEIHERIAAITQFVKQEGTLINYEDSAPQQRGAAGTRQRKQSGAFPSLKRENITYDRNKAQILGVRKQNGNYGPQVAVKVGYRGQTWLWYLNEKNDKRTKFLVDSFSANEENWNGREFYLYLENDEFTNAAREQMELVPTGQKKAR